MYLHHGALRYVPREGNPVHLGRDYGEAMVKWASIVKPAKEVGTVASLIDWYLVNVAPGKAPRTYRDNMKEAEYLKKGLGHIPYTQLKPYHVAQYRDARARSLPIARTVNGPCCRTSSPRRWSEAWWIRTRAKE